MALELWTQIFTGNPDNEGELGFLFYNLSNETVVIEKGDKIGQVNSISKNEYPVDGKLEDSWYYYIGYENNGPYKSHFVD